MLLKILNLINLKLFLKLYLINQILLKNCDCSLDEKTKDKKFNFKEILEQLNNVFKIMNEKKIEIKNQKILYLKI